MSANVIFDRERESIGESVSKAENKQAARRPGRLVLKESAF
jgi:hypothetical protein